MSSLSKFMRDRVWAAAEGHDFAEAAKGMAERAVEQYERLLIEGKE